MGIASRIARLFEQIGAHSDAGQSQETENELARVVMLLVDVQQVIYRIADNGGISKRPEAKGFRPATNQERKVHMATIDDVFNLLTAVNQTTLGRMESKIDAIKALLDAVNQTTLGRMEGEIQAINLTTLGRMEGEINDTKALLDAVNQTTLGRIEGEVVAIQQKVGA